MNQKEIDLLAGYIDESPYPECEVSSPNHYYAELLFEDYGGRKGEVTTYLQCLFLFNMQKNEEKDLAIHIQQLARAELLHMELIGELLNQLQVAPVYRSGCHCNEKFWSSDYVFYGRNVLDQLKANLELEYESIKNYNIHIRYISDPKIRKVLERIVKDELVHVEWYKKLIRQYGGKNFFDGSFE